MERIEVSGELAASHARNGVPRGWTERLPALARAYFDAWELTLDGPPMHGVVSFVLPVLRIDGSRAVLKLQPVDGENAGEALGLRSWGGEGIVRLLADDPITGTLLLERLDAGRPLSAHPDPLKATQIIAGLLARLHARRAPQGLRHLKNLTERMVEEAPAAVKKLADPSERREVLSWASIVRAVLPDSGDSLLHWDLHFGNVLAADREPWLAIDPKPLTGHPAFDLLPALRNRWEEIVDTGDIPRAVRRRFDIMTEILTLDRPTAAAWTLARTLQNTLWDIEAGENRCDPVQTAIAAAMKT